MATANKAAKPTLKSIGLDKETLLGLYSNLLKTRLLDERFRKLFRQGRFAGTYFSAVGQEATTVVPAFCMKDGDIVAPSHREIGASVTRGVPTWAIVAQVYARTNSPDKGKSHPCHYGWYDKGVIAPASTLAGQTVVGTGCAMGFKIQKKDSIVIAWTGEGATSRGGYHEALNYAGIHDLPIVYICQNNLWAESVPATLQAGIEDFSDRAKAYGFPGVTVDGNDFIAVYREARKAVDRARTGGGPTLIECKTYRWYGHSEIDPANYRSSNELDDWKRNDPLGRAETLLMDLKVLDKAKREALVDEFEQEIDDAISQCENEKYAEPEEAYNDVYSEDFPVIRHEY